MTVAGRESGIEDGVIPAIVDAEFSDWTLRDWQEADEGTDFVAFLDCDTPDGERRVVLKVQDFLDPVSFRPEPRTLDYVATETDIPVPGVIASDLTGDEFPPYFCMTHVEGDQPDDQADLSDAAIARVARTAGHNLAQLHALPTWDAYGWLRHVDDVADPGTGHHDLTPADPHDSWPAFVAEGMADAIDRFPDRFADLQDPLREAVDDALDELPTHPRCAFLHGDYRLGNLLIDVETGETRAVLDWGNHTVGDPLQDLVKTEDYLCDFARRDSPRRRLVRDALLDGYREVREIDVDPAHRDAYLLCSRIGPLAWFDLWFADADDPDTIAEKHRAFVESYR